MPNGGEAVCAFLPSTLSVEASSTVSAGEGSCQRGMRSSLRDVCASSAFWPTPRALCCVSGTHTGSPSRQTFSEIQYTLCTNLLHYQQHFEMGPTEKCFVVDLYKAGLRMWLNSEKVTIIFVMRSLFRFESVFPSQENLPLRLYTVVPSL